MKNYVVIGTTRSFINSLETLTLHSLVDDVVACDVEDAGGFGTMVRTLVILSLEGT